MRARDSFEAQHLVRAICLAGIHNWTCMLEGPKGSMGWQTTNARKEKSCLTMRSTLNQGKLFIAEGFFSLSLGVEQARRRIRDELCRFSVITAPPTIPFAQSKRTYSGKVAGMQDDVAVVLQIALEATVLFYSSDKYRCGVCESHIALRMANHASVCRQGPCIPQVSVEMTQAS